MKKMVLAAFIVILTGLFVCQASWSQSNKMMLDSSNLEKLGDKVLEDISPVPKKIIPSGQ